VLERLSDPLVHLIRNAVDHGVEAGADRLAAGKSEAGTVTLAARHQSSNLVIEIRDDGAGLDADRLKAKAVEKGILNAKAAEALSDRDAYNLIFASGFSTKAVVSDVSGRGVGMDVVKTNIEEIQGEVLVDTVLGKGTTFTIRLPLTMAIIDGMTAICGDDRYVIPLAHIHETTRPAVDDVHTTAGLGEVYVLRGESLPLFRLSQLLGHKTPPKKAADGIAVVVRTTAQPFAVLVDDVVGQSQIVIKQLGPEHRDLRGFSGSAIMGDGRATLILELPELVSRFKGATAPSSMRRSAA
jgi:two-component system chemotaxis sensor kinase CheA